jgi:hypothetical protein
MIFYRTIASGTADFFSVDAASFLNDRLDYPVTFRLIRAIRTKYN